MTETNSQRAHLRLNKTNIERPRYKRKGGPGRRPKRDNTEFGNEIIEKVSILQETFEQSIAQKPPEFDPEFIFRIQLDGDVSEDEWRRSGLTLLSEEPNQVVVLFSEDLIAEFRSRVDQYREELPDEDSTPPYGWIAAVTEEMALWGRADRIERKLSDIKVDSDREYRLDVELWSYGSQSENEERRIQLQNFVENNDGEYLDHFVGGSINISRVKIPGAVIGNLLDVDIVEKIDLPPEPGFGIIELVSTPLDDFRTPIAAPDDNVAGICVIDSGINRGHPMLGAAIGDSNAFPSNLGDGLDDNGHGTMVSGIALYSDVSE